MVFRQEQVEDFEKFIEEDHLYNYDNYGQYAELVKTGSINIFTKDISNDNLDTHFTNILNIMRDGIETDKVHNMAIIVHFMDNESIRLSLFYSTILYCGSYHWHQEMSLRQSFCISLKISQLVLLRVILMKSLLRSIKLIYQ